MARWVCWLSNGLRPYAAYRGLITVIELAADKRPGVRLLGCGETWMRLIANCNHMQSKDLAMVACGNTQLCVGLRSGIESNLHAVRAIWPQSAGWAEDSDELGNDLDGAVATNNPHINHDAADDDEDNSCYTPDTGFGVSMFDACNTFQEQQIPHAVECRPPMASRQPLRLQPLPPLGDLPRP